MDYKALLDPLCVSIPFDQGNVFRPYTAIKMYETCPVSIPFDQGNVFRPCSGLCLLACTVSIPFDQGNVFRQKLNHEEVIRNESQSLSIRAMSFDGYEKASLSLKLLCLNPFRSGQCLSTSSVLVRTAQQIGLNPFRSGQCLSTSTEFAIATRTAQSQSLSIRAMSFDIR